jgi:hypothetical protein
MVVIINLAIGSLVMNMYPKLYPPFFPFDLKFFFQPVEKVHSWLYALLVTFSLFGINMAACLIESTIKLLNSDSNRLKQWAALLIHFALFLTMGAHLYDGFYGNSGHAMITPEGTEIAGIGQVRTESIVNTFHPDGSLKDTAATLAFKRPDGTESKQTLTYNQPALFDGGTREVIIQSGENQPVGLVLANQQKGDSIDMLPYEKVSIPGGSLSLQGVFQTRSGIIFAEFHWTPDGGERQSRALALNGNMQQHNKLVLAGNHYVFKEMIEAPYLAAMIRYNPAIPLILISLLTATLGTILLIYLAARGRNQNAPA